MVTTDKFTVLDTTGVKTVRSLGYISVALKEKTGW